MKFLLLFWIFLRIGLFTVGGSGYTIIPLIQKEVVQARQWIGADEFTDILAMAHLAPGPISANATVFIGYRVGGIPGALSSLTGFLLPAVISVLLLAIFISHFKRLPLIHAVFAGLRPAVFGLLLAVAWSLSRVCVVNTKGLLLAIMVILSCVFFNVHPFLILLAAGLIGGLWFR